MKIKVKPIALIFFFVISLHNLAYSQKLKSDGYACTLKEITKETLRTCGDANTVYKGTIIVKSKDKLAGTYPFYFSGMGKNISMLQLKNPEGKLLSPTLLFDELKREFYYNKDKPDQQKIFVADEKTDNEVILEGMMLCLKIKKQSLE